VCWKTSGKKEMWNAENEDLEAVVFDFAWK
jgi:hypothetical protein